MDILVRPLTPAKKSFFLFGPRGTGKYAGEIQRRRRFVCYLPQQVTPSGL